MTPWTKTNEKPTSSLVPVCIPRGKRRRTVPYFHHVMNSWHEPFPADSPTMNPCFTHEWKPPGDPASHPKLNVTHPPFPPANAPCTTNYFPSITHARDGYAIVQYLTSHAQRLVVQYLFHLRVLKPLISQEIFSCENKHSNFFLEIPETFLRNLTCHFGCFKQAGFFPTGFIIVMNYWL